MKDSDWYALLCIDNWKIEKGGPLPKPKKSNKMGPSGNKHRRVKEANISHYFESGRG